MWPIPGGWRDVDISLPIGDGRKGRDEFNRGCIILSRYNHPDFPFPNSWGDIFD